MRREVKDTEQFVKFYMDNLKLFFNLSPRALKVVSYVMSVTKPNIDNIYFDMEDCKNYTSINSKTTIISALSELISNDFLAVSSKRYLYFINPSIFFNGNRVTFINSAIKQNDETKKLGDGISN
jgi:regulatory protein YycH of two-component signal transduction system YycFG